MAAQMQVTNDEIDILTQLQRNDSMRWSEFEDRGAISRLIKAGLVRETGGNRITLSKHGVETLEALEESGNAVGAPKVNGNGKRVARGGVGALPNGLPMLSESERDMLEAIAEGIVVKGRGVGLTLGKLRNLDYIRMGANQWEVTAEGRERLAAEGIPVDAPPALPAPAQSKPEPVEQAVEVSADTPEEAAASMSAPLDEDGGEPADDAGDATSDERIVEIRLDGLLMSFPAMGDLLNDEGVRERVMRVLEREFSPAESAAPDEPVSAALVAIAAHDCDGCASGCLHRKALALLMEKDERVRVFFERYGDYDAAKLALDAAARAVDAATDALRGE